MKTLVILGSPRSERSKSIELARHAAQAFGGEITEIELGSTFLPFLTEGVIAHNYGYATYESLSETDKKIADRQTELVKQIKETDNLVIASPMWNFSVPAAVKAWLDLVIKVNDTFSMSASGYLGLVNNVKKAIVVGARSGAYLEGPYKPYDFQTNYLTGVLGFIGITNSKSFYLEGTGSLDAEAIQTKTKELESEITAFVQA